MVLKRSCFAALATVGCFSPTIADGTIQCDVGGEAECPPGLLCRADGRCYRSNSELDAGDADGGMSGEPGTVAWANAAQGPGYDQALAVAAGATVVAVGLFNSPDLQLDDRTASADSSDDGFVADLSPVSGEAVRLRRLGGPLPDSLRTVVVAADGSRLVAGWFGGTVSFGGGQTRTAMGLGDGFVAKYEQDGDLVWVTAFPGSGSLDSVYSLAVDPSSGDVYAAGKFDGSIDFLDGNGPVAALGVSDAFVVALNPAGETRWAAPLPSDGLAEALSISYADDQVVVVGQFEDSLLPGTAEELSAGLEADAFVVSYSAAGVPQWSRNFGASGRDVATAVEIVGGSVFAAGAVGPGASFAPVAHAPFDNGLGDGFVVELNSASGTPLSLRELRSSTAAVLATALALDPSGAIAVAGRAGGTVNFGAGDDSGGPADAFVALYPTSIDAAPAWARRFVADGTDSATGVSFDGAGRVVASGWFGTTIDFDGEEFSTGSTNPDVFVVSIWQ